MRDFMTIKNYNDEYIVISAWAQDFVRAMWERTWIFRLLFRIAVGRYAYREFTGMVKEMDEDHYYLDSEYGLEECDYNKQRQPLDFKKLELHH
jgi:hypothetical protein